MLQTYEKHNAGASIQQMKAEQKVLLHRIEQASELVEQLHGRVISTLARLIYSVALIMFNVLLNNPSFLVVMFVVLAVLDLHTFILDILEYRSCKRAYNYLKEIHKRNEHHIMCADIIFSTMIDDGED